MQGQIDIKGFEILDLHETVMKSGKNTSEEDTELSLNMDEDDPVRPLRDTDGRGYKI